jgi:hypothetical protein
VYTYAKMNSSRVRGKPHVLDDIIVEKKREDFKWFR